MPTRDAGHCVASSVLVPLASSGVRCAPSRQAGGIMLFSLLTEGTEAQGQVGERTRLATGSSDLVQSSFWGGKHPCILISKTIVTKSSRKAMVPHPNERNGSL